MRTSHLPDLADSLPTSPCPALTPRVPTFQMKNWGFREVFVQASQLVRGPRLSSVTEGIRVKWMMDAIEGSGMGNHFGGVALCHRPSSPVLHLRKHGWFVCWVNKTNPRFPLFSLSLLARDHPSQKITIFLPERLENSYQPVRAGEEFGRSEPAWMVSLADPAMPKSCLAPSVVLKGCQKYLASNFCCHGNLSSVFRDHFLIYFLLEEGKKMPQRPPAPYKILLSSLPIS